MSCKVQKTGLQVSSGEKSCQQGACHQGQAVRPVGTMGAPTCTSGVWGIGGSNGFMYLAFLCWKILDHAMLNLAITLLLLYFVIAHIGPFLFLSV